MRVVQVARKTTGCRPRTSPQILRSIGTMYVRTLLDIRASEGGRQPVGTRQCSFDRLSRFKVSCPKDVHRARCCLAYLGCIREGPLRDSAVNCRDRSLFAEQASTEEPLQAAYIRVTFGMNLAMKNRRLLICCLVEPACRDPKCHQQQTNERRHRFLL